MRKRFEFITLYGVCWIILFQFFRIIFLLYHYKKTLQISSALWVDSAWHGLKMDISFASYILLIPALLTSFTFTNWRWFSKFVTLYSAIVSFLIVFLIVADLELFRAWGFRIDSTSFHYLQTPMEAWASMSASPVFSLFCLFLVLYFLVYKLLHRIQKRCIPFFPKISPFLTIPVFTGITAALIIPVRGGVQQIPLNESAVFFSRKSFANYAAVNVPWNYVSSIINSSYSKNNPFVYFDEERAENHVEALLRPAGTTKQITLANGRTNVVVIIWESFTAKVVEGLDGAKGITPQFEALSKEGILFTNMYSSGNRSDKGMVAILSGYPAQPVASIIKIPNKSSSLPSLPKTFHKIGYFTSFYYGGETEFANMKSYFQQQEFDQIIDKSAFSAPDMNSKWGAHDHVVLNRLLSDLDVQKQPFFTTVFTLSSHEPFEVPVKTVIKGNDTESLFLNAHHYSDAAIGDFIKKAKTKPWWKNTLIVILADHGHPLPELPQGKPGEFHIPMLWLGGVLKERGIKIDSLCSQTDFASTLLNQFKLPSQSYRWSNDIFRQHRTPFAYFAFNNGFGWVKPNGFVIRDNIGGNITEQKGNLKPVEIELGKAYLQTSFNDYLRR